MIKRLIYILWSNDMNAAALEKANDSCDRELGKLLDEGWRETSALSKSLTFKRNEDDAIIHRDIIVHTLYKRGGK